MQLQIADNLTLPAGAVTETIAIIGKRGTGKTSTAVVLAEEMLKCDQQIVVFDPLGVWWGLRTSADGIGIGMPIYILGGAHADLPLEPDSGSLVADLVVEERLSIVLDVGDFTKGEQHRFITAFADRLYRRKNEAREPLHLFVDEADEFLPQQVYADQAPMLGAMDRIVRRGRVRGLGVSMISQRPAVVNKNAFSQVEVLIVLQLTAPQDRKAVDDWISAQGTPEERKALMASLPGLPRGDAWIVSPRWLSLFERVTIRPKSTFDSSATPRVGEVVRTPQERAPVDLDALRDRLALVIAQAKEDDPTYLQSEIRRLLALLKERPTERVEVPVLPAELATMIRDAAYDIVGAAKDLHGLGTQILTALDGLESSTPPPSLPARSGLIGYEPESVPEEQGTGSGETFQETTQERDPARADVSLPQRRILDALADLAALGLGQVAKSNVAVFAGQSPISSGYTDNLGRLRTAGLIDYPMGGYVMLTEAGRREAKTNLRIKSLSDLHNAWLAYLRSAPRRRILEVVISLYPKAIRKEALAKASQQSPTSSGYTTNLGALRSLGLIDYPQAGYVMATALLFPKGLA